MHRLLRIILVLILLATASAVGIRSFTSYIETGTFTVIQEKSLWQVASAIQRLSASSTVSPRQTLFITMLYLLSKSSKKFRQTECTSSG